MKFHIKKYALLHSQFFLYKEFFFLQGFEPQTLYILCIVPTNWVKFMSTYVKDYIWSIKSNEKICDLRRLIIELSLNYMTLSFFYWHRLNLKLKKHIGHWSLIFLFVCLLAYLFMWFKLSSGTELLASINRVKFKLNKSLWQTRVEFRTDPILIKSNWTELNLTHFHPYSFFFNNPYFIFFVKSIIFKSLYFYIFFYHNSPSFFVTIVLIMKKLSWIGFAFLLVSFSRSF